MSITIDDFTWIHQTTPYASRISTKTWDAHKDQIIGLYGTRTLDSVMQMLSDEHGFSPTKSQYTTQLKVWGFKKNKVNTKAKQDVHESQSCTGIQISDGPESADLENLVEASTNDDDESIYEIWTDTRKGERSGKVLFDSAASNEKRCRPHSILSEASSSRSSRPKKARLGGANQGLDDRMSSETETSGPRGIPDIPAYRSLQSGDSSQTSLEGCGFNDSLIKLITGSPVASARLQNLVQMAEGVSTDYWSVRAFHTPTTIVRMITDADELVSLGATSIAVKLYLYVIRWYETHKPEWTLPSSLIVVSAHNVLTLRPQSWRTVARYFDFCQISKTLFNHRYPSESQDEGHNFVVLAQRLKDASGHSDVLRSMLGISADDRCNDLSNKLTRKPRSFNLFAYYDAVKHVCAPLVKNELLIDPSQMLKQSTNASHASLYIGFCWRMMQSSSVSTVLNEWIKWCHTKIHDRRFTQVFNNLDHIGTQAIFYCLWIIYNEDTAKPTLAYGTHGSEFVWGITTATLLRWCSCSITTMRVEHEERFRTDSLDLLRAQSELLRDSTSELIAAHFLRQNPSSFFPVASWIFDKRCDTEAVPLARGTPLDVTLAISLSSTELESLRHLRDRIKADLAESVKSMTGLPSRMLQSSSHRLSLTRTISDLSASLARTSLSSQSRWSIDTQVIHELYGSGAGEGSSLSRQFETLPNRVTAGSS